MAQHCLIHLLKGKKYIHSGLFVLYKLHFRTDTSCYRCDIGKTIKVIKCHYVINVLYINEVGMQTKYDNFGTVTLSLLPDFHFKVSCLGDL